MRIPQSENQCHTDGNPSSSKIQGQLSLLNLLAVKKRVCISNQYLQGVGRSVLSLEGVWLGLYISVEDGGVKTV